MDTSIYRQLRTQDFFIKDLDYSRRVRVFRALRDGRSAAGPKKMKIQVRPLMNTNNTQTPTTNEKDDFTDIVVYLAPTEVRERNSNSRRRSVNFHTFHESGFWNVQMKMNILTQLMYGKLISQSHLITSKQRIDNCAPPPKDLWNISLKDFVMLMAQSKVEVS